MLPSHSRTGEWERLTRAAAEAQRQQQQQQQQRQYQRQQQQSAGIIDVSAGTIDVSAGTMRLTSRPLPQQQTASSYGLQHQLLLSPPPAPPTLLRPTDTTAASSFADSASPAATSIASTQRQRPSSVSNRSSRTTVVADRKPQQRASTTDAATSAARQRASADTPTASSTTDTDAASVRLRCVNFCLRSLLSSARREIEICRMKERLHSLPTSRIHDEALFYPTASEADAAAAASARQRFRPGTWVPCTVASRSSQFQSKLHTRFHSIRCIPCLERAAFVPNLQTMWTLFAQLDVAGKGYVSVEDYAEFIATHCDGENEEDAYSSADGNSSVRSSSAIAAHRALHQLQQHFDVQPHYSPYFPHLSLHHSSPSLSAATPPMPAKEHIVALFRAHDADEKGRLGFAAFVRALSPLLPQTDSAAATSAIGQAGTADAEADATPDPATATDILRSPTDAQLSLLLEILLAELQLESDHNWQNLHLREWCRNPRAANDLPAAANIRSHKHNPQQRNASVDSSAASVDLIDLYNLLDCDGDGFLSVDELASQLCRFSLLPSTAALSSSPAAAELLARVVHKLDRDFDGRMLYVDFASRFLPYADLQPYSVDSDALAIPAPFDLRTVTASMRLSLPLLPPSLLNTLMRQSQATHDDGSTDALLSASPRHSSSAAADHPSRERSASPPTAKHVSFSEALSPAPVTYANTVDQNSSESHAHAQLLSPPSRIPTSAAGSTASSSPQITIRVHSPSAGSPTVYQIDATGVKQMLSPIGASAETGTAMASQQNGIAVRAASPVASPSEERRALAPPSAGGLHTLPVYSQLFLRPVTSASPATGNAMLSPSLQQRVIQRVQEAVNQSVDLPAGSPFVLPPPLNDTSLSSPNTTADPLRGAFRQLQRISRHQQRTQQHFESVIAAQPFISPMPLKQPLGFASPSPSAAGAHSATAGIPPVQVQQRVDSIGNVDFDVFLSPVSAGARSAGHSSSRASPLLTTHSLPSPYEQHHAGHLSLPVVYDLPRSTEQEDSGSDAANAADAADRLASSAFPLGFPFESLPVRSHESMSCPVPVAVPSAMLPLSSSALPSPRLATTIADAAVAASLSATHKRLEQSQRTNSSNFKIVVSSPSSSASATNAPHTSSARIAPTTGTQQFATATTTRRTPNGFTSTILSPHLHHSVVAPSAPTASASPRAVRAGASAIPVVNLSLADIEAHRRALQERSASDRAQQLTEQQARLSRTLKRQSQELRELQRQHELMENERIQATLQAALHIPASPVRSRASSRQGSRSASRSPSPSPSPSRQRTHHANGVSGEVKSPPVAESATAAAAHATPRPALLYVKDLSSPSPAQPHLHAHVNGSAASPVHPAAHPSIARPPAPSPFAMSKARRNLHASFQQSVTKS